MVVQGLGLYYTMQCQAACAHCGVWSSPDRRERMSLDQARGYIEQLAELGSAKVVVFVGGEPLIHLDDICTLIAFTQQAGIGTQVSTNGFWAHSDDSARRTLDKLAAAGLEHLALSADAYHAEFIPPASVGRALRIARDYGMIRKLQVIRSQVNEESDELFRSTGIEPSEVIDHSVFKLNRHNPEFDPRRYIVMNRHWVAPFGRGAFLQGHTLLQDLDALEDLPCFMARRFPIVYPNGDFYTCCCTAGFYKEYAVGNLERQTLADLDRRMHDNVVFEAISLVGPVALAKAVRQSGRPASMYANPCHACRETLARTDRSTLDAQSRKLLFWHSLLRDPDADAAVEALI